RREADLPRITFARFGPRLETRRPGQPRLGGTSQPADDPVRLYPHPGMGLPASERTAGDSEEAEDSRPPVRRTPGRGVD
ncbi:type VI secretion system baseplate subunit TssG, partial [Klebsiella pneumoniae]|nr:type VI secretion system baseplate subunit TssG [Klebsiella pneumoniae]